MQTNSKLDELLPALNALKHATKYLNEVFSKLGAEGVSGHLTEKAVALEDKAKALLGIRAASNVTYIRLPQATHAKSRSAFVRECRRLTNALDVPIPAAVMNAMEAAAAVQLRSSFAKSTPGVAPHSLFQVL